MPLVKENSQLYEVFKIQTVSGQTLKINDTNSSLTVDKKSYSTTVTFTRPSNTTPYTAGDVIGSNSGSAIITLNNLGPTDGFILIQTVSLILSDPALPAGIDGFRIHLYNSSPGAIADNAPFDLTINETVNYLGYINLSTPVDLGSSLYSQNLYFAEKLIKLPSASNTLYAEIQTINGYTPSSGSTLTLTISSREVQIPVPVAPTPVVPSTADYWSDMSIQLYGWESIAYIDWWGN